MRGADVTPEALRAKLKPRGTRAATLLLVGGRGAATGHPGSKSLDRRIGRLRLAAGEPVNALAGERSVDGVSVAVEPGHRRQRPARAERLIRSPLPPVDSCPPARGRASKPLFHALEPLDLGNSIRSEFLGPVRFFAVVKARFSPSLLAAGVSIRVLESLALIWNRMRFSNSFIPWRSSVRFKLLTLSHQMMV